MSSVFSSIDRVVSRVQMSRYAQQQRVEGRRDRNAHERAAMHNSGIAIVGTRPTAL